MTIEAVLSMFFTMVVAHALCDYPLQGDFLARAKNATAPLQGVPWQWAMGAHCMLHAGAVYAITGSWWLALGEFVVHWVTDSAKCHGILTFSQDQTVHIAFKLLWALARGAA